MTRTPASRFPGKRIHGPEDLSAQGFSHEKDVGEPGAFPFTRGIAADLYAEQPWIMGQYSGFSSAKATNERFKQLLAQGQTGFSIALDLPTQMGLDSDHPLATAEVGRVGVPLNTLLDMEDLLDGLDLSGVRQIRTTANSVGPIIAAMIIAAAEKHGYEPNAFRMMVQNDPLKEYIARGTFIFPPRAGLRFACDLIEYCAEHIPRWEPIEFCGYHVRDSGCDAVQEIAITFANALAYLEELRSRGVDLGRVTRNTVLFLAADVKVLEEAAKFRAARRLWARLMAERYNLGPESQKASIFTYTLGGSLTAQDPLNNIVRVAYQALAAAMGGVQTLATSSYDEALGLPSAEAVQLSLRTQQILAYETDAIAAIDPLGGSYYVESLTLDIEQRARALLDEIESRGGAVAAIESGYVPGLIADASYGLQQAIESGERVRVGVNTFVGASPSEPPSRPMRPAGGLADAQASLAAARAKRDETRTAEALARLAQAAERGENTMPAVLAAVRSYASIGEICDVLRARWGTHRDSFSL